MKLIDEIMVKLDPYVTDSFAVSNILYVLLNGYDIKEKTTEIAVYKGETNELLLKRFLVAKKVKGCTDRTLRLYATEIPKILDRIGKDVVDITPDDIRFQCAVRLQSGVSKRTVGNELRYLRTFFSYLHGEGAIIKNPMMRVDPIKENRTQKEAFTDDEIVKMRNTPKTSREDCIFELLLCTGCRVTELAGIQLTDIDYREDKILVHGKGQKDRYCYLNASAKYALNAYLSDRKDQSVWLFPGGFWQSIANKKGIKREEHKNWYKDPEKVDIGRHVNTGSIEDFIRTLGRKNGVKAYPHKFRRTCATNALRAGMPIEMVSKMLGHANIGVTQLYLDLKEEDLKIAHNRYVR